MVFVAPFLRGTGGPAPSNHLFLFTDSGRLSSAAYSVSVYWRDSFSQRATASTFSSVFLEHVCRAHLCLVGNFFFGTSAENVVNTFLSLSFPQT